MRNVYFKRSVSLKHMLAQQETASHEGATVSKKLKLTPFSGGDVATRPQNLPNVLTLITEEIEVVGQSMPQMNTAQGGSSRESTG